MDKTDVSIIIPTKNGAGDIEQCLSGIFRQRSQFKYEVIVIDSGSTDNTRDIVGRFPVKIIEIKPEEFGHGKTRNLGGRLATGKYLVYLSQDAFPADENWLENLIINFDHEKVAGVYSRWLPKADCNPMELRRIADLFGPIKQIKNLDVIDEADYTRQLNKCMYFTDVSSALFREIWEKIPYNDESVFAEDQEWSRKVLEAGYTIIYEPKSRVYHSHDDSLKVYFQRGFDFTVFLIRKANTRFNLLPLLLKIPIPIVKDWVFILKLKNRLSFAQKIRWLFYSAIRNSVTEISKIVAVLRA